VGVWLEVHHRHRDLIGGLIAEFFGTGDVWELNILGLVLAVIAAVLLIGMPEGVAAKNKTSD
jgi:uncharacterized membrane protein YeaQ/YmgE (transglycosylase-associated protein family)